MNNNGFYPRPRYDADLRGTLTNMCSDKAIKNQEIADTYRVSLGLVKRYRSHLLYYRTTKPTRVKPKGRSLLRA